MMQFLDEFFSILIKEIIFCIPLKMNAKSSDNLNIISYDIIFYF